MSRAALEQPTHQRVPRVVQPRELKQIAEASRQSGTVVAIDLGQHLFGVERRQQVEGDHCVGASDEGRRPVPPR